MSKKPRVRRCPIQLDPETYEIIRFISKGEGKPSTEFMKEHFKQLMQLCARFDTNPFALSYEFTLFPEPKLIIKAEGKSTFQIGEIPKEGELEAERKRMFDEVKLSIAEINNKTVKEK